MGNIASEVGRSFNYRRQAREAECEAAMVRALDLFDATTTTLIARKSPKTKEVLRAKEEFLNALYGDGTDEDNMNSLEYYFMQFAIAARLKRNVGARLASPDGK